ncbi:MAG TPA: hypothetical protein PLF32_03700 [Bacteroidales bacterium]|nr:hypothetical protein [Bacteroidales bacterium]HOR81738.1 hypothetical protein [Bacteroidales bacterium]HPJ91195.1 hypothetical protein [Bacteroidales bacterium]
MKNIQAFFIHILLTLLLCCQAASGQNINLSKRKYHLETQKILNTVINSEQFDSIISIHHFSSPIFVENELLPKKYHLVYKKKPILILDTPPTKETVYWIFGHYVFDIFSKDPTSATIQLSAIQNNKELLIGVRLFKKKKWILEHWEIIVDELE